MTQDLSAFARQLKATLGVEEKEKIRMTIQNIESFTSGLDEFVSNYQNIVSDQDQENIQLILENLKNFTLVLHTDLNKEIISWGKETIENERCYLC